jgi:hypothetical protein
MFPFDIRPDDNLLLKKAFSSTKFTTFWDATTYITLSDRCKCYQTEPAVSIFVEQECRQMDPLQYWYMSGNHMPSHPRKMEFFYSL